MQQNTNPLRLARDRAGLTQVALSLSAKLSLGTIRNAERGIATKRTLARVARALGVAVDDLTGRRDGR